MVEPIFFRTVSSLFDMALLVNAKRSKSNLLVAKAVLTDKAKITKVSCHSGLELSEAKAATALHGAWNIPT